MAILLSTGAIASKEWCAIEVMIRNMIIETPAFIVDETQLQYDARLAADAVQDDTTHLLFAMKSFSISSGLATIAPFVKGFAASSLFEAQLGRRIIGDRGVVQLTSPGLREDEIDRLANLCNTISFNSLSQWRRLRARCEGRASCGLRVNPELSFVGDSRYDPCRPQSKLGIPLSDLCMAYDRNPDEFVSLEGLHIHSNCDSHDFTQLLETVRRLVRNLDDLLGKVRWLNLGGGYLFFHPQHLEALTQVKEELQSRYDLQLFIEPGASIVRRAGAFMASVVDLYPVGEQKIAVLDTSVNHMPEVFEYQFSPDVAGEVEDGAYNYLLAGSSCLAGDLFGHYSFKEPLTVGSKVMFKNMGAYSMVKANMFNGINLPAIYSKTTSGEFILQKQFAYEDFLAHCGE